MATQILDQRLSPRDIGRSETITEKTFANPNLRRLAAAADGCEVGDRISVYQKEDGSLSRVEQYGDDEDKDYLLRRLHDMALRFQSLFEDSQFRALFPLIRKPAVEQLSLF